jgi:hypothetical protein
MEKKPVDSNVSCLCAGLCGSFCALCMMCQNADDLGESRALCFLLRYYFYFIITVASSHATLVIRRRVVVVASSSASSCKNCYSCIIPRPFLLKMFQLHYPTASKSPYNSIIPRLLLHELPLHIVVVSSYVCLHTTAYGGQANFFC